jgi:malate dehydrogenase (oxaloacetate-decarboxylating)
MILAAAKTLGEHAPATKDPEAPLLPLVHDLRSVAVEIAVSVGLAAQREGVAPPTLPEELRARILATQWTPTYPRYTRE